MIESACVSECIRVSDVSVNVSSVWSVLLWCVVFVKCVGYVVYGVCGNVSMSLCVPMCVHVSTPVCRVCVWFMWCVMCDV